MHYSWYFGDAHDGFLSSTTSSDALQHCCDTLRNKLHLQTIVLLQQTHGTAGHIIDNSFLQSTPPLYGACGDFLITQCTNIGIGVVTADCVPIVITDIQQNIVAVVHAGWRGTLAHITLHAIKKLTQHYNCNINALRIYIGPCAGACCYQVQPDFITTQEHDILLSSCIIERNSALFFDIVSYNKKLLIEYGIEEHVINISNHCCTICNTNYCSYRRDATNKRQITLAWIQESPNIHNE